MRDHDGLLNFIESQSATPFDWLRNDCARYAAGAIVAQGQANPLHGFGGWRSLQGAMRALRRAGGLEAAVSSRLRRISPAMAQRGDIAGVPDETMGLRLMVVEGETLVGPGPNGNHRSKRQAMTVAWSSTT